MRISNPEEKGRIAARIVQGIGIFACIILLIWGQGSVITIDSTGSPGKYRTGITEKR